MSAFIDATSHYGGKISMAKMSKENKSKGGKISAQNRVERGYVGKQMALFKCNGCGIEKEKPVDSTAPHRLPRDSNGYQEKYGDMVIIQRL
jgi:hypothetical protein